MTLAPISVAALVAATVILLLLLAMRQHQRATASRHPSRTDAIDTVAGWQPEATRVLTVPEMQALAVLQEAMPGYLVLAQVPLARFLRVPTRNSYADWLARAGRLSADLLLCDGNSRVLAAIDVRAPQESERSRRRHERMVRVLRAAGIAVHAWHQERLPTVADVRAQLNSLLSSHGLRPVGAPAAPPTPSRPMPLIPVPDVIEVLAEGDALAAVAESAEPVASGFFDDLEMGTAGGDR
jgi:hypothetical protein